eukprot:COSAG02_NODE_31568_length_531_cov_1.037037_1_plen_86_part_00
MSPPWRPETRALAIGNYVSQTVTPNHDFGVRMEISIIFYQAWGESVKDSGLRHQSQSGRVAKEAKVDSHFDPPSRTELISVQETS